MSEEAKKTEQLTWSCKLQKLIGEKKDPITVGDKLGIICQGDDTPELLTKPFRLEVDNAHKYKLNILEVRSVETSRLDLVVTSYKPGNHDAVTFQIVDDAGQKLVIKIPDLNVTSVIKKESMQQPKPYGPLLPFTQPLPWWFYGIWIALFFVLGVFVIRKAIRYNQRKQLLDNLEQFQSALGAYGQFNKDARSRYKNISMMTEGKLTNELSVEFVENLKSDFDMYLVRELSVPAHIWTDKQVMSEIKKRHSRLYKKRGASISNLLKEFSKTIEAKKATLFDCEQLVEMSKRTATEVHLFQKRSGKA